MALMIGMTLVEFGAVLGGTLAGRHSFKLSAGDNRIKSRFRSIIII